MEKHEEGFQIILNTLRCDMVTSFKHYNDIMDRRVAVRFLSFPGAGTGL